MSSPVPEPMPASPSPAPAKRRPVRRFFSWLLVLVLLLAGGFAFITWRQLRASLPQLDGELELAGLSAPVRIDRDSHGVPTIRAKSKNDLVFGLGFLHAQDRFFQMDLLRRDAAGELAELLGPAGGALVEHDQRQRVHRFRVRCQRAYGALPPDEKAFVDA